MRILSIFSAWLCAGSFVACTTGAPPPSTPAPEPSAAPSASPSAPAAVSPAPTPSKEGPAGAMCGGLAGFGCATGLYCAFAVEAHCGAADQSGICKVIPQACAQQAGAVCGCNDKTYASECEAAREGVSIGSNAACAPAPAPTLAEGQLCGTRGVRGDCGQGLYCKYKSLCGATDSGGTCTRRPEMCTKIYRPVCGCDGKTHPSDCVAASEGTAVKHDGACKD
jgi:hypothetical protein